MKKIFTLIALCISITLISFAQSPYAFKYQAIARNSSGLVLANQNVGFKISLLQGSNSGPAVYSEEHNLTTNSFGLVNLEIGNGTNPTSVFANIDWATGPYFIKIEFDATGGSTFTEMGTSQLLSVPYALFAASGTPGPQGPAGNDGQQGIQGNPGADGISIAWLGSFITPPITASLNNAYYNSTNGISYIYDGSAWQIMTQDGAQGIQGIQGLQGPAGTGLNNRGVWVSGTSYAGSDYVFDRSTNDPLVNSMWICQNSGSFISSTNPYLDNLNWVEFQAPAGPQGIQGIAGTNGTDGIDGAQGLQGIQGPQGIQGTQGEQGLQGLQGIQGIAGINGVDGKSILHGAINPTSEGTDGDFYINTSSNLLFGPKTSGTWGIGVSLIGPQGIQGIQGAAGTGLTNRGNWITGTTYSNGDYVFDRSLGNAAVNSMWICQTISFISATQPYQDATHWVEFQAPAGPQGIQGLQGIQGIQGVAGTNGTNGVSITWQGTLTSAPGSPSLNMAYYNSTDKKSYIYNGTVWQIITQDGAAGTQGIQGVAGINGTNGISIIWQGTLASAPASPTLNMAYYNSTDKKSYIYNGTIWQIITQDGSTGAQGIQGVQGIQGIQGLTGPAGTYTAGSGILISSGIISNTSPNQIVGLAGLGATSVSGTYPNFTISSTDNNTTYSSGTGLSLSGTTFNSTWTTSGLNIYNNNTGFVGIGTTNPTTALHINGSLRITDETQGNGKILTSDINGNASWQNPVTPAIGTSSGSANYIPKYIDGSSLGNSLLYETGNRIGLGTTTPSGKFQIQQDVTAADNEPIFEVKDKAGKTVMVIYQDSIHFYVKDPGGTKTNNRGSFAVSGKSSTKAFTHNYLLINPDSTRIYTSDSIAGFGTSNISGTSTVGYMQLTPKNYFIGHQAGNALSSNINNTGRFNSFIGYQSGYSTTNGSYNVFMGYQTGFANVGGEYNTFIGYLSGKVNTSSDNTFLGYKAGMSHLTGGGNVFIGSKAGQNDLYGVQNIFIGENSGFMNNNGSYNVSLGFESGYNNVFGSYNTFIGYQSGYNNINAASNVIMGYQSGFNNNGNSNVLLGYQCGYSNTSGYSNVMIGNMCGRSNVNGFVNTFIGELAGYYNTDGTNNVFIGYQSGYNNTTANGNIFMGRQTGYSNLTGWGNLFLGNYAGYMNTAGSNNVLLGYNAGMSSLGDNNVSIGPSANEHNVNGTNNVSIGAHAGFWSTGGYNVFIGYQAGYNETGSDKLYIDNSSTSTPLIGGDFTTNIATINGLLKVNATDNKNISLLGNGFNSSFATINFGDANYVFIQEDVDDKLQIYAASRTSIMGGNVGIGLLNPSEKLEVSGNVKAVSFIATTAGVGAYKYDNIINMNVPDYVFDKHFDGLSKHNPIYKMMDLNDLQKYIATNRHLPRVPSRADIEKDGVVNLQGISMINLEKTEENTIYILQLKDKIDNLEQENSLLKLKVKEIDLLKTEIEKINSIIRTTVKK